MMPGPTMSRRTKRCRREFTALHIVIDELAGIWGPELSSRD
jgi:hypothetical protein